MAANYRQFARMGPPSAPGQVLQYSRQKTDKLPSEVNTQGLLSQGFVSLSGSKNVHKQNLLLRCKTSVAVIADGTIARQKDGPVAFSPRGVNVT